ncbi:MAG: urate hydroxylase PuuD [Arenicellales bacterium]
MGVYELEWLALIMRWLHVIIAAVWIGTSFYIFSWENKFNKSFLRKEIEGNFWTIQGGDFYYVEKHKQAPETLPDELHWFKYEAYLTWVSGFILLSILYYSQPSNALIKPAMTGISTGAGIVISLVFLVFAWLLYNLYCKTRLVENLPLSAGLGILAVTLLGFLLSSIFTGRAAVLHIGAIMGTIMSANVFFIIIPWHKSLLHAIENKHPLDALYKSHPGVRSDHNHYMTLPVFFIMLSIHLPVVHSHPYSWVIVPVAVLAAGFAKHVHTKIQQGKSGVLPLVVSVSLFISIVFFSKPGLVQLEECEATIDISQIYDTVSRRCTSCHSSTPSDPSFSNPPNGVVFDTPKQVISLRSRILERSVTTQTMPPDNKTGMTPQERRQIRCWVNDKGVKN